MTGKLPMTQGLPADGLMVCVERALCPRSQVRGDAGEGRGTPLRVG
jgi:hypothetical protein